MPLFANSNTPFDFSATTFLGHVLNAPNYVLSGGVIATLNDLSPNQTNLTNAGAAAGPGIAGGILSDVLSTAGINGFPSMTFGANIWVKSGATGFPAGDCTILAVHQPVAADFTTGNSCIVGSVATLEHGVAYRSSTLGNVLAPFIHDGFKGQSNVLSFAGNPEIVAVVLDSINKLVTLYQNGVMTIPPTSFATFASDTTIQIGNFNSGANQSYNGEIGWCQTIAGQLSPDDIQCASEFLAQTFQINPTFYVFDGDSLTFGTDSTGINGPYPAQFGQQLAKGLGNNFQILNAGVFGDRLVNRDLAAITGVDTIKYPIFAKEVDYLIFAGTNDFTIDNLAPADAFARLLTLVNNRAATRKYAKLRVATLIPRQTAALSDTIAAFNALCRDTRDSTKPSLALRNAGCTSLVDFASLPIFNYNTAWANTTYYNADGIHGNNASYGAMATLARTAA